MQLSEKERRILSTVELHASSSMDEICAITHYTPHVNRYGLRRLREKGIISRPQPFINAYRLGYVQYLLYFSLGSADQKSKNSFLEAILDAPEVAWILETGGDYQYVAAVCIKDTRKLFSTLYRLLPLADNILYKNTLSICTSYSRFNRKYLADKNRAVQTLFFGAEQTPVNMKDINLPLLNTMVKHGYYTLKDLAELLALPLPTVERHKKTLERKRVIEQYYYDVDISKIGMQSVLLAVSMRGTNALIQSKLYEFARKNLWIVELMETIGSWDYVIGAEVADMRDMVLLTEEMYRKFGDHINDTSSLLVYRQLKTAGYHFEADGWS